jgi:hypothetical protein
MNEKNSKIVAQLPRCGKVLANPKVPGRADPAVFPRPGLTPTGILYAMLRMAASVCQLVPDAFVRFPSSERSSTKSPFRQVNAA